MLACAGGGPTHLVPLLEAEGAAVLREQVDLAIVRQDAEWCLVQAPSRLNHLGKGQDLTCSSVYHVVVVDWWRRC